MKAQRDIRTGEPLLQRVALVFLLGITFGLSTIQRAAANTNVVVWDTLSPFVDTTNLESRAGWKLVPTDLLTLEADSAKASSDPGYYGRDYSFGGDAVVENGCLTALFWSANGRVVIYSKGGAPLTDSSQRDGSLGKKIAEFVPLQSKTEPTRITHCEILRNGDDQVVLEISFDGSPDDTAVFSFGKTEVVDIKPGEKMKGIRLLCPIEYGIVPGFVGDDLIVGPAETASVDTIWIPAEHVFLGLLKGEENMLVMTWPKGKQQLKLRSVSKDQGKRVIDSIDFDNDGQSFYLAPLGSPGLWHREQLTSAYLEKDVAAVWKRPFPAKWTTQLYEAGVRTTFAFKESKGEIWRGVPGSYSYPVWFDGDNAFYHLSKKVPPKGDSLVYFLEGKNTPLSISTPVDIMKATLGLQLSDTLLDIAGRKLRTHHRRGGEGVHRACTCGVTEFIQAIFEAREEVENKKRIAEALDDMIYFVQQHVARIDEYRHFADDMIKFLRSNASSTPELKPFADSMEQIVAQIPQEYSVQKENMKSPGYADELVRKTLALTGKKDATNLKAYMDLLEAWRGMGGAQDYVVAQCHTITRKLFQEAGYGSVTQPKAIELAQEIRRRCRQALRNPDGYEIWADY